MATSANIMLPDNVNTKAKERQEKMRQKQE